MRSLSCFTSDLCWRNIVIKDGLFKQGLVEQPPRIQPIWEGHTTEDYYIAMPWVYYDIQQSWNNASVTHYAKVKTQIRPTLFHVKCLYFSPRQLTRSDQGKKALSLPPFPNIQFPAEYACYPHSVVIPTNPSISAHMDAQTWRGLTDKQRAAKFRTMLTVDCHRLVEEQIITWWNARFNRAYTFYAGSAMFQQIGAGSTRHAPLCDFFQKWEALSLEDMLALAYPQDAKYEVPALTRSCFDKHGQRRTQHTHKVRKVGKSELTA